MGARSREDTRGLGNGGLKRRGTGPTKSQSQESAGISGCSSWMPWLGRPQPGLAPAAWHDPRVSYLPWGTLGRWKVSPFGRPRRGAQGGGEATGGPRTRSSQAAPPAYLGRWQWTRSGAALWASSSSRWSADCRWSRARPAPCSAPPWAPSWGGCPGAGDRRGPRAPAAPGRSCTRTAGGARRQGPASGCAPSGSPAAAAAGTWRWSATPAAVPRLRPASDAAGQRLRSWAQPGPAPGPPDARPGRPAPCTRRARTATASLPCPLRFPQALSPGKLSVPRPGWELGAGGRCGRAPPGWGGAAARASGLAGGLGERVWSSRGMSHRAPPSSGAALRRRPLSHPLASRRPHSVGLRRPQSNRAVTRAVAAAATPSGGARDGRAGRQRGGGATGRRRGLGGATQAQSDPGWGERTLKSPPTPLRREGRKGLVCGQMVSACVKCTAGNSKTV